MSILAKSIKGKVAKKPILIVYGEEGVGKSTFAAGAPNPYFIDVEEGTGQLDVERSPKVESFDMFTAILKELLEAKHAYQTAVIDTVDALEALLFKKICEESRVKTIVEANGGYGAGYKRAMELWAETINTLRDLRAVKNMGIIVLGHNVVSTYNDPTVNQGYDRFSLKLHESNKLSAVKLWMDSADAVLFAKRKVVQSEKIKGRAIDGGEHVLYTQRRPAFDAKNRYDLPFELPLSWSDFDAAMKRGPRSAEDLKREANDYINKLKDQSIATKALENILAVGDNTQDLENIVERLKTILSEQGV